MPRNGAGVFSVLNPILVGRPRSSADVNENFSDAGVTEITNTLPINGEAGMTGQLKAAAGSALEPGISFNSDTNLGFRLSGPDSMAWVAGGQDRATMDENGKLTLNNGLELAGAPTHASGAFSPIEIATTSVSLLTLRNTSNDTNEHSLARYGIGNGTGVAGALKMVGGGANDVATLRYYQGPTAAFEWTASLFTHIVDALFGAAGIRADADGYLDFPEIATPTVPTSNVARIYARDDNGVTRMFVKTSDGTELAWQPPTVRQVFTSSDVWTKPAAGQTMARIEMWGGGGSGGAGAGGGGGGGGGCYAQKVIALASLSASVSVTIGAGGAADTGNGAAGGQSSFGAYLSAFGGGGGGSGSTGGFGAGGGGLLTVGDGGGGAGGQGGTPRGILGVQTLGDIGNANPFGGGGGRQNATTIGAAFWGGGGGGKSAAPGSPAVYGGGGGGGNGDVAGGSVYGGAGGNGSAAGTAPGGGGGGDLTLSGAGARGEVRVTCW